MKTGVEIIAQERMRQKNAEGWTDEHDDKHTNAELSDAAACYATYDPCSSPYTKSGEIYRAIVNEHDEFEVESVFPRTWGVVWDKRPDHPRIRRLQIAGALIAAEIDRHLRAHPEDIDKVK